MHTALVRVRTYVIHERPFLITTKHQCDITHHQEIDCGGAENGTNHKNITDKDPNLTLKHFKKLLHINKKYKHRIN